LKEGRVKKQMIKIVIGGDICPIGNVAKAFANGNAQEIFHDLLEVIQSSDLSITNLECPLVSQKKPIPKSGPALSADIKCINGFVNAKIDVLNLANNHILDHGSDGLKETITIIQKASIKTVGAGINIMEAQKPLIKEIEGKRIVLYSMAEHEFSIADEQNPGANPLDIINFVNAIRLYKKDSIFIVLIHGGNEYYSYPSPEVMRRCRFMVEMGADAVVCSHTHCALPWETYRDRPIIYGMGNLIFESLNPLPDIWYEGFLTKLIIENSSVEAEIIPYHQSRAGVGARLMVDHEKNKFFETMQIKCEEIKNPATVEKRWIEHCKKNRAFYLSCLFAYNRVMHKLNKFFLKTLHSEKALLDSLNMVECEAHREVVLTILKLLRRNK
jgi:poly-gamma-glutamate synthesis protein (capsule biosynthesis protein)